MAEYLAPDVYVEDGSVNANQVQRVGSTTGGFIGVLPRGEVNKPVFVSSWSDFVEKFSKGLDSPFLKESDTTYSIYGFFQNGGRKCYITRVVGAGAKKASKTQTDLTIKAKDEGKWGNALKVSIKANEEVPANFNIKILLNNDEQENYINVSNTKTAENYWVEVVRNSNFISEVEGNLVVADLVLEGGDDDITSINDTVYTKALELWDNIDDLSLICVPGQTSETMSNTIMSYAERRLYLFAILDAPKSSTVESVLALRKKMSCKNAVLLYPYIKIQDMNSRLNNLRECPSAGHYMGVVVRTILERGIHIAPAGTKAQLRGAVDVVTTLSRADVELLNPKGVIPILPQANYGIVVWGARSLHPDTKMKYISDSLLNIMIKKSILTSTKPFVFEPNVEGTWVKVETTVKEFMETLRSEDAFAGKQPNECYFVKCDSSNNTEKTIAEGQMICEVGYAPTKPSEFVIFRVSHSLDKSDVR